MNGFLRKFSSIKLTRKEFLLYMGTLFLGILGISSILKLISEVNPSLKNQKSNKQTSFGTGGYGV
ncbi:hypothetical protein KKH23_03290 [Patescibacteria group bacterium]|nr:hypothetical protein [Patescibacteria group bacterium]MBU0777032.1 hypothetical protein [Patescibacteria group bacterium]MBU0846190.1 hypothetical protein [Patescibacteria group bacterium]MBU0923103.1 hypothetical protein [Patescibacteria group bacterium]MBU1066565.1 hypothetical protein [Patescibacteria group bacterium]